jgi:hypothetical protein
VIVRWFQIDQKLDWYLRKSKFVSWNKWYISSCE